MQSTAPANFLAEVAFRTSDAKKLGDYLQGNKFVTENLTKCGEDPCFAVLDPERHRLIFVQESSRHAYKIPGAYTATPAKSPIIHAGFVVHDRAAEDRFYKDVLGFHVYWHGGMQDDQTDWVDMQVPEGTDWIEYMLNVSPNAYRKELGVMNHIAIGVADIHAAENQLIKNNWKPTEEPQIGRDGKWQLNLYDPDGTRVEFMEFKPTSEPCCAAYSGSHPGPK